MKQPHYIATLDQGFLVVDCQIIGKVDLKKLPLYILAAYLSNRLRDAVVFSVQILLLGVKLKRQQLQLSILWEQYNYYNIRAYITAMYNKLLIAISCANYCTV